MNRFLILFFILLPTLAFSQSYQYIGTPQNIVKARGGFMSDSANYLPIFSSLADTVGLTTYDRLGNMIFIRNISSIYFRDTITGGGHQWSFLKAYPGLPLNSIQFNNNNTFGGDSLQYYPSDNKLLTSQDYWQYGRPVTGFFQSSNPTNSTGRLWTVYPRGSSGSGADTLQPFFSEMNTTLYDVAESENPVFTLLQFGNFGNSKPLASIRLEQNYYDLTEYHALTTKPRLMDPNGEIRHWSWTISQINGTAEMATRSTSNIWKYSALGTDYDKQYATLNSTSFGLSSITNIGSVGATAGYLGQWGVVMQIDTTSGGQAQLATSAITNELQIGPLAMSIINPNAGGGTISLNKFTQTVGKEFRAANIPNGTTGLSVTTSAVGFIYSVSADASGFADTRNTGTFLINRDVLQSASTRMLGIYNNYNADDSLFHVRGNGNLWTKGLVNIKTLKTTLTAPATEGTTKMVICDTNGLLSNTDLPTTYTFNSGLTNTSGTVRWNGSLLESPTIDGGSSFSPTFTSTRTGTNGTVTINNTSTGRGINVSSGSGVGIRSVGTTGIGVQGVSTDNYGLWGQSSTAPGLYTLSSAASGAQLQTNPTSTNTNQAILELYRLSQSAGANNISGSVDFYINNTAASGTTVLANQLISKLPTATSTSETSQFILKGINAGSQNTLATFDGNANATFGTTNSIVGTATNNNAVAGNIGEEISSYKSIYANYTTTATYQASDSIILTAGDWDISAVGSFSGNGATLTAGSDAIFVISTTINSPVGSTEGKSIVYVSQTGVSGTNKQSVSIAPFRVSLSSTTTYYLNTQATFTAGNPQFATGIRARRIR